MIDIMLIAGDSTENLNAYLTERGSLRVVHHYSTLFKNIERINKSIINVDKLVYICDNSLYIRQDMACLKGLLQEDSFFTVREITFFIAEGESSDTSISYFRAVMQDIKFNNFTIEKSKKRLEFSKIYEVLLGYSSSNRNKNTYNTVYRVEIGDSSKNSYEPQDTSNIVIEPFSYKSLEVYETTKSTAAKSDNGLPIIDDETTPLNNFDSVVLPGISPKEIIQGYSSYLLSGNGKSGSTTFTIEFGLSAIEAGRKVLMIDLCANNGIKNTLDVCGKEYHTLSLLDIAEYVVDIKEDSINLISSCVIDSKLRLDFLRFIINNLSSEKVDTLIVNCDSRDLLESADLLSNTLKSIYLSTHMVEFEVRLITENLYKLGDKYKVYLLLNDNVKYLGACKILTPLEIKSLVSANTTVIKPIQFENFYVDDSLYRMLMEVS